MKTASTLFINTLAQTIAKIATTATTLLVTYLLTQKYGTSGLGEFITATSYAALFYLLADFGINATFTKRVHNSDHPEIPLELTDEKRLVYYFKNMLSLRIILGVVVTFIALSILSFLGYPTAVKVAIILASLLIINQAIFTTASGIFQIKLSYQYGAIAEIAGSIMTLSLVVIFVSMHWPIIFVILGYVLGSVVRSMVALYLAKNLVGGVGVGTHTKLWQSFVIASLPLGMIAIFSQVMANIDKVILSLSVLPVSLHATNIQAVGIYGLAYKFFDVSLVIPTYVMNAAFPMFVRVRNQEPEKLMGLTKKIGLALVGFAVVGAIVGYLFAPWVIGIFNKSGDLGGSVTSLRILLLGLPIFYFSPLLVWLAISLDKQKPLAFVYLIAALFNFSANLVLIPIYGYIVAAWLTILTEVIIIIGSLLLLKGKLQTVKNG